MSQPARKVAGALASGCSIILKAAEETPAGAMHIVQAFHDVGLPPGVLNLVFGIPADISQHLITSDVIRLVAFTGSTSVGRHLTGLASDHMTPVLMELGGHAPVIVCEDVDTLVTAFGQEAVTGLEAEMAGWDGEVLYAGDCLSPRTVEEATLEGLKAALAV